MGATAKLEQKSFVVQLSPSFSTLGDVSVTFTRDESQSVGDTSSAITTRVVLAQLCQGLQVNCVELTPREVVDGETNCGLYVFASSLLASINAAPEQNNVWMHLFNGDLQQAEASFRELLRSDL